MSQKDIKQALDALINQRDSLEAEADAIYEELTSLGTVSYIINVHPYIS